MTLRNVCTDVTQNATLVHHFDSEAKKTEFAMEAPYFTPPKKSKRVSSARKVMTSIFGKVVMVDYFEKVCMVNGAYCAEN